MRSAAIVTFLLAAVAWGSSAAEKSADPYIVVTKTVSSGDVIIGTPVTVTVTANNIGHQPAYNVELTDVHPLGGEAPTKSAEKLASGENITISYSFTPTELGPAVIPTAECAYSPAAGDDDNTVIKSFSNYVREELDLYRGDADTTPAVRGTVMVMTAQQYDRIHSTKILELVSYFALCAVSVAVPYLLFKSKLSQIDSLFREAKKKSL